MDEGFADIRHAEHMEELAHREDAEGHPLPFGNVVGVGEEIHDIGIAKRPMAPSGIPITKQESAMLNIANSQLPNLKIIQSITPSNPVVFGQ